MLPVSLEAIEDLASRLRAVHVALARAELADEPAPPLVAPDVSLLVRAYPVARAADPALGVLVAEAIALDASRRPHAAYRAAWARHPIVTPGEQPIAPSALPSVLALESNEHRRAALGRIADSSARDTLDTARDTVDALRALADTLGLDAPLALHGALGLGDPALVERASEAVFSATEEPFRELSEWARTRLGLARTGELTWVDRLRTLAMVRATELVPLGDRAGIASRWLARVGLDGALARVRDETRRPSVTAAGVRAFSERPGERAVIEGTGSVRAQGAVELTGAVTEAVALVIPREERPSARLGVDRVHHAVAEALGRRLFLAPTFLQREASVDRAQREPVLFEVLHAELFAMRMDAALARFGVDLLARAADLPARMRAYTQRAVGSAPSPMWAAHDGARWLAMRPGPRVFAALIEARVEASLRAEHDEDWFRNPRAGESVQKVMDALREHGALAWGATEPAAALDPAPLAQRVNDVLRDARR